MKIALDYDDTFTRDPTLWNTFIRTALLRDHEVMIVTYRFPDMEIENPPNPMIPVFYTSAQQKRQYMVGQDIIIDVWIDDTPDMIVEDYEWI